MAWWNPAEIANVALSWIILIVSIIIFGAIAGASTWYAAKQLKFKYPCTIFEYDGSGHLHQKKDRGGVYIDKKVKMKRFFLKYAKVGLDPNNIPWVASNKGLKQVYLLQTGLKNFRYIHMNISSNPGFVVSVGEEDVNWAITDYERQKKLFSSSLLLQLLPYMALAFVSVIILIIFIYFFKDFAVLKDVAIALKEAATQIAQAKGGTTIVQ